VSGGCRAGLGLNWVKDKELLICACPVKYTLVWSVADFSGVNLPACASQRQAGLRLPNEMPFPFLFHRGNLRIGRIHEYIRQYEIQFSENTRL